MRGLSQHEAALAADAYLAWWSLAGVDDATGETPTDWLRPVISTPLLAPAPIAQAEQALSRPAGEDTPQTLELFRAWLADDPAQPERRWASNVILPIGNAGAPLMIITDLPDPADVASGVLLSDQAGLLFDAMLRAIGLSRQNIYLASLFTARPPGGMVESADLDFAARRMRSHVGLVAPQRLLLLGDRTVRTLLPEPDQGYGKDLRNFNHDKGIIAAIATFHPRLLLNQPAAKAECWLALQKLIEEKNT